MGLDNPTQFDCSAEHHVNWVTTPLSNVSPKQYQAVPFATETNVHSDKKAVAGLVLICYTE